MADYIFSLRTDYNQDKYSNSVIPCWEREYRLNSVTEEDMVQRYLYLAAQFTLVTWFVIAFPLAPLILYLINIWDIRHKARKLLLSSRRPLLIKTPGTEMTKVFYFIVFIAVLTNAINILTVNRCLVRYVMANQNKKPHELFHFFHFHYYEYGCYAADLLEYGPYFCFNDIHTRQLWLTSDFFMMGTYGYFCFSLLALAMSCLFLIIRYTVSRQREVELVRATEEKIRNLYNRYELEYKDSKD